MAVLVADDMDVDYVFQDLKKKKKNFNDTGR